MTRITSFNLPKKSFISSAAEDSHVEAGPSSNNDKALATEVKKKSKRRGRRGKSEAQLAASDAKAAALARRGYKRELGPKEGGGWKRDPEIAKRAKYAAERAEERRIGRRKQRESSTTCFACRSVGHSARDCPNVLLAVQGPQGTAEMLGDVSAKEGSGPADATTGDEERHKKGMKRKKGKLGADLVGNRCYRCNANTHSLTHCPEPVDVDNPTPFATCYICLARGHLASLCPNNAGKGIYVNGGSCKVCGSTAHRAKHCPDLPQREESAGMGGRGEKRAREIVVGVAGGADEDDWMVQSRSGGRGECGAEDMVAKRKKGLPGRLARVDQSSNRGHQAVEAEPPTRPASAFPLLAHAAARSVEHRAKSKTVQF